MNKSQIFSLNNDCLTPNISKIRPIESCAPSAQVNIFKQVINDSSYKYIDDFDYQPEPLLYSYFINSVLLHTESGVNKQILDYLNELINYTYIDIPVQYNIELYREKFSNLNLSTLKNNYQILISKQIENGSTYSLTKLFYLLVVSVETDQNDLFLESGDTIVLKYPLKSVYKKIKIRYITKNDCSIPISITSPTGATSTITQEKLSVGGLLSQFLGSVNLFKSHLNDNNLAKWLNQNLGLNLPTNIGLLEAAVKASDDMNYLVDVINVIIDLTNVDDQLFMTWFRNKQIKIKLNRINPIFIFYFNLYETKNKNSLMNNIFLQDLNENID